MEIKLKLKPTNNGLMVFVPHDIYIGRSLDLYGEFSVGEQEFFKFISRGGAAVDVGANIGAHSLCMARCFSHVYSFEPQEVLFRLLKANLAQFSNTTCYCSLVGNDDGVVGLPILDYTAEGNNLGGYGKGMLEYAKELPLIHIQQRALDKIEELNNEEKIDLIKVDVEGMEKDVLEGAQRLIHQHQPILYVENDKPEKAEALVRFIYNLNYKAFWHVTFLFNPNNFAGNKENVFGHTASFNLICIPNGHWLTLTGTDLCTPENPGLPKGCLPG